MATTGKPRLAMPQRALQFAVFWAGVFIVGALLIKPTLGLYLLWDVLIPIAPLLLVVAPGLWRNICPLGTFSVMPHWLRLSKKRSLSQKWQSRFFALAVALLLVIVPARHVILDSNGPVMGIVLVAVALLAFGLGMVFDWKSAWCSGLCPVYPVELLYGSRPVISPPNLQCQVCTSCVKPCRETREAVTPAEVGTESFGKLAATVIAGGFPGFILGWYLVDVSGRHTVLELIGISYAWPFAGLIMSILAYSVARNFAPAGRINQIFATLAVGIYYYFKLPVVFGLAGESSHWLVHSANSVPVWSIWVLRSGIVSLLIFLLLGRGPNKSWNGRPLRVVKEMR